MKIIPDIPKGLGDNLLNERFGNERSLLADLLLKKIALKNAIKTIKDQNILCNLQNELLDTDQHIKRMYEYLNKWYTAYFNLCSKCSSCIHNHNNKYCEYYGENKIPRPDPDNTTKQCEQYKYTQCDKVYSN